MSETQNHRRSIRLEDYDYTQHGAYFVTLITAGRVERFGVIIDGEMQLNLAGQMLLHEWQRLPARFPGWMIDAFVIMPNHIHGILINVADVSARANADSSAGAQRCGPMPISPQTSLRPYQETRPSEPPHVIPGSLGAVVRAFKSSTTLRYHSMRGTGPGPLWQRNYYEHILRGPADLEHTCAYIQTNPIRWELDQENPGRCHT